MWQFIALSLSLSLSLSLFLSTSKIARLTANGGSGGLGLGCTRSTGCRLCCVSEGLPLLRRLRFSGAGVSSLCGVKAGVSGGVCVGLCEPGSGLPSSESFRLLVRFLASDSGIPDDVDTTVTFDRAPLQSGASLGELNSSFVREHVLPSRGA